MSHSSETTISEALSSPAGVRKPARRALAWYSPVAQICFWTLVIGGVGLDLWSKEWAFHRLRQSDRMTIVPYFLEFQTMFNPGALFGIGRGQTELFLGASIAALVLVFVMFARSHPRHLLMHIALGGIFAGALGNMYDRTFVRLVPREVYVDGGRAVRKFVPTQEGNTLILREYPPVAGALEIREVGSDDPRPPAVGYVRDFIKINSTIAGREIWPWVFNVADMLLVGGVAILALKLTFEKRPAPQVSEPADATWSGPGSAAGAPPSS